MTKEEIWNLVVDKTLEYGPKVLLAIVVLLIGLRIIKVLARLTEKGFNKRTDDPTLGRFMNSMIAWTLKVLLFVSVAAMLGIETTSFVAILGAAGLAIGLALQGTLSNFAGGVLLLIFKPYKIGDYVKANGEEGAVIDIQIFNTILETLDGRTLIVPNGATMNGNIANNTRKGILRAEVTLAIAYKEDIRNAKKVLLDALMAEERILNEPAPTVHVKKMGDSAVVLQLRGWTKLDHYLDMTLDMMEIGTYALREAKIEVPFPQLDVHIKEHKPIAN